MKNELHVQNTDTTWTDFSNSGEIDNFTVGFTKRIVNNEKFNFFFGGGINLVPNFEFDMNVITQNSSSYFSANESSIGFFLNSGLRLQIFKFIYFKSAFRYSYIPSEFTFTGDNTTIEYNKVDLGGFSIIGGLSFIF